MNSSDRIRFYLLTLALLSFGVLLSGCEMVGSYSSKPGGDEQPEESLRKISAKLLIDPNTGCHYLVGHRPGMSTGETLTPRLRADGTSGYGCRDLEQAAEETKIMGGAS